LVVSQASGVAGGLSVAEDLTLKGELLGDSLHVTDTWTGIVRVQGPDAEFNSLGDDVLVISGKITDTGNVTTVGPVTFAGTSSNDYAGTTFARGTLRLHKRFGATAIPGDLVIGDPVPATSDSFVILDGLTPVEGDEQIADGHSVLIKEDGTLDLN